MFVLDDTQVEEKRSKTLIWYLKGWCYLTANKEKLRDRKSRANTASATRGNDIHKSIHPSRCLQGEMVHPVLIQLVHVCPLMSQQNFIGINSEKSEVLNSRPSVIQPDALTTQLLETLWWARVKRGSLTDMGSNPIWNSDFFLNFCYFLHVKFFVKIGDEICGKPLSVFDRLPLWGKLSLSSRIL